MNSRCGSAATLFSIACALLGGLPVHAQSGPVVARAAGVTGQAVLTSGTANSPLLLTAGYILTPGDRIDTRAGGRVVIDLSDGSMVVVAPGSMVVLKDYRTAGSLRELFEITLGSVRVKINHFAGKPNPYRMNSPTASIAVRGTEFTVAVAEDGGTQVDVIDGLVEVSARSDPSRSVLLEAGRGALVPVGQGPRLIGAAGPGFGPGQQQGNRDGDHAAAGAPGAPAVPGAAGAQPNRDPHNPAAGNPGTGAPAVPGARPPQMDPEPHLQNPMGAPGAGNVARTGGPDHDDGASPRATASTYDRYLAGLADIGQVPFLLRFNAFSEAHLDSLENPAYASQFRQAEGRVLFLPTWRGARTLQEYQSAFGPGGSLPGGYSVSPEASYFTPLGGFTLGGAMSFSRIGDSSTSTITAPPITGDGDGRPVHEAGAATSTSTNSSSSNYFSGALVAARRMGANSFGVELATLRGSGGASASSLYDASHSTSDVTQTGLTAGFTRDLTRTASLGVFYRYAFINATDRDTWRVMGDRPAGLNATDTAGHTSEAGIRLRGRITPRLSYGATAAWLGISLHDGLLRTSAVASQARERAQRGSLAFGLGYALGAGTVLTFDVAGGTSRISGSRTEDATSALLQNGVDRGRFASFHGAVQHDLTRRLFVSASLLEVWQRHALNVDLFPDRFGSRTLVEDSFFRVTPLSPYASRFSDFGAGWRFTPDLYAQYVYSTDYGVTSATHTLMLRWTFHKRQ